MKKLLLLLLSLVVLSCNTSRKTNTDIENLKQNSQVKSESDSGTKTESGSQTKVDLSRMIDEFGLVIKGDGKQYSLNYGGLQFVGSADLELKNKKDVYRIINVYHDWNIYHNWNVTTTREITKTNYKTKSKNTAAEKDNFWLYILVGVVSIVVWELIKFYWKKYNPLQIIKKWIR